MQLGSVRAILSRWTNGGPLVATPQALLNGICFDRSAERLSWLKFICFK